MNIRDLSRLAFTFGELSKSFGVSKDSFKRRAKDGSLRTILVGGRRLVPASEVARIESEGLGLRRKVKPKAKR